MKRRNQTAFAKLGARASAPAARIKKDEVDAAFAMDEEDERRPSPIAASSHIKIGPDRARPCHLKHADDSLLR
jgi:hypothetical protein